MREMEIEIKKKKVIKISINFEILEQVDYNKKSKKVIPTNQWKRQNYIHNRSIVMTRPMTRIHTRLGGTDVSIMLKY